MVLYLPFKSDHRACGVGPSVGMRAGDANELQSTTCVTRDKARQIAANVVKLPGMLSL